MSVAECVAFLRKVQESPNLRQVTKAVTATAEMTKIGRVCGYRFDARDLAVATSAAWPGTTPDRPAGPGGPPPPPPPPPPRRTVVDHHEFDLASVPGLAAVAAELPHLMIRPATVALDEFDARFRAEDMRLLDRSPVQGPTCDQVAEVLRDEASGPGAPRRDFHLVNLDEHVDHPGYADYFAAKTRVITALETFFDAEIRFSGSMWYPPRSYRMWHTNEAQPGWRMYLVAPQDGARAAEPGELSYFRYRRPDTGELVTLAERFRLVRFFRVEQDPRKLFWHCIANPGPRHRWSFGFVVPDAWMDRFPGVAAGARQAG
jgi:hypothetical protein